MTDHDRSLDRDPELDADTTEGVRGGAVQPINPASQDSFRKS